MAAGSVAAGSVAPVSTAVFAAASSSAAPNCTIPSRTIHSGIFIIPITTPVIIRLVLVIIRLTLITALAPRRPKAGIIAAVRRAITPVYPIAIANGSSCRLSRKNRRNGWGKELGLLEAPARSGDHPWLNALSIPNVAQKSARSLTRGLAENLFGRPFFVD